MFKRIYIAVLLLAVCFTVVACGKTINSYVLENMAEVTYEYYFGENDSFYASLSVGERESEFYYNGQCTSQVDFSLLTLYFYDDLGASAIKVDLLVGEDIVQVELVFNSLNNTYMADIVDDVKISGDFSLTYGEQTLNVTLQNYEIDYLEAIEIACENLGSELEECRVYGNFYAECYLRIMMRKDNGFDDAYWCFTCLDYDGESFSIILSVDDGSVLAKS